MKRQEPRLDQHGFPIPYDFDTAGVDRPGDPNDDGDRAGGGSGGRWLARLLKLGVLAGIVVALWFHFNLSEKVRQVAGQYHAQQAVERYRHKDIPGALAQADRALAWNPDSVLLLFLRAQLRRENDDHNGALVDVDRALEIKPNDEQAQYLRSLLLHRLHRHREAAAAATEMIARQIGDRAASLNSRAYARALEAFELDEALADIDEALREHPDNASFLDTRGYVLFKLGRNQEALDDLEKAIALTEKEREEFERAAAKGLPGEATEFRVRQQTQFDENLAVMYHHRGEVNEKLGHAAQAKKDRFIGVKLGYDPAAGIY